MGTSSPEAERLLPKVTNSSAAALTPYSDVANTVVKNHSTTLCADTNCLKFEQERCWLNYFVSSVEKREGGEAELAGFLNYKTKAGNQQLTGDKVPWGGYYFPYLEGGITQRWQKSTARFYNAAVASDLHWSRAQAMSSLELSQLSPAEKMDIYLGNSDFRITKRELRARATTRKDLGGGFCNGARAAGLLTQEPTKPIRVKPNGFAAFDFYPADIKALFTVSYFYPEQTVRLGDLTCYVEPDILDIALRYFIGERNEGICGDMDPSHDHINNMAILGYDRATTPLTPNTGGRAVQVKLTLYCLTEFSPKRSNQLTKPMIADFRHHIGEGWLHTKTYDYTLRLNEKDEIISGFWLNPTSNPNTDFHPDFIWIPYGKGNDENNSAGYGNPDLKYEDILRLSKL